MNKINCQLNSQNIVHWFSAIRNLPESKRNKALDAFWDGQIDSKAWLINELNSSMMNDSSEVNVYVFGSWLGVLSSMLFDCSTFNINTIRGIDIDPECQEISNTVCYPWVKNNQYLAVTDDMSKYEYDNVPHIVINTSSEHVEQSVYDEWYDRIPYNTLIVVQGNNFFECPEHQRCASSIVDFKRLNHVSNPIFSGHHDTSIYTRFMCMWRK